MTSFDLQPACHPDRTEGFGFIALRGQIARSVQDDNGRGRKRGFTIVELMVLIGILILLLSIFIPALLSLHEGKNRARCGDNLRQIRTAIQMYADANNDVFPRVVYDEKTNPSGYTCYTGADADAPFAAKSEVQPNDVTASLWLLVRGGLIDTGRFVCPSTNDIRDPLDDGRRQPLKPVQRGNFRRARYLSYSLALPFTLAEGYKWNDTQQADFAMMADMNPGIRGPNDDVLGVRPNDAPLVLAKANSNNHDKAGQNVLYADGHVSFHATAFCGLGSDNIYTALVPENNPPAYGPGAWGTGIGPSWFADSYLVPVDDEGPR